MSRLYIFFILIFVMTFTWGTLAAQEAAKGDLATNTEERKGAFNEPADKADEVMVDEVPYYFRNHNELPTYFSGFAIELTSSDLPLRKDYYLFKRFGSVFVDVSGNGKYIYMITGFDTKKSAQSFLKNIVIHQAPDARVLEYNKGKPK